MLAAYSSPPLFASPNDKPNTEVVTQQQPSAFASALVDTMLRYVGHKETAPNRSPIIDAWSLKTTGQVGLYWCAIMTYACADKVAEAEAVHNPLPRTASVSKMLNYAHSYGSGLEVVTKADYGDGEPLLKGDIGCIKKGTRYGDRDIETRWNGHQYTVQYQQSDGDVKTVEGNTNIKGGRNGDRVAERIRDPDAAVAFIRIP